MSTRILPEGRAPWLKDGAPVAGGRLYTYEAGTTTNKATYHDQSKAVAHANPIILASDGRPPAPIYWDGEYKYVLKDANDALVYEQDDYGVPEPAPALSGGSLLPNGGFEADGDGDGLPDSWTITALGSNTIALDDAAANVKSGDRSLKFTTVDGDLAGTADSELIPWVGGETLYLQFWGKRDNFDLSNLIKARWYSDSATLLSSATIATDTGILTAWIERKVSAVAPAGAKFLQLRIEGSDGAGTELGTSWFDDIRLERLPAALTAPTDWVTPTLEGTWVARDDFAYRLTIDGEVEFRGGVDSGTSGSKVFDLPTTLRPGVDMTFGAITSALTGAQVSIDRTLGGVTASYTGTDDFVYFSGIRFFVE